MIFNLLNLFKKMGGNKMSKLWIFKKKSSMMKYNWRKIILHHSLTKDGNVVDTQAIRKYHINTNKWFDIGYHFCVDMINGEYEILIGRPLVTHGAHTRGQNKVGIGICLIGNYDKTHPSKEALNKLSELIIKFK